MTKLTVNNAPVTFLRFKLNYILKVQEFNKAKQVLHILPFIIPFNTYTYTYTYIVAYTSSKNNTDELSFSIFRWCFYVICFQQNVYIQNVYINLKRNDSFVTMVFIKKKKKISFVIFVSVIFLQCFLKLFVFEEEKNAATLPFYLTDKF